MRRRSFSAGLRQKFHKLMSLRMNRFSVPRPQGQLPMEGTRQLQVDQAFCARKTETEMLHDRGSLFFQPSEEARGRVRASTWTIAPRSISMNGR